MRGRRPNAASIAASNQVFTGTAPGTDSLGLTEPVWRMVPPAEYESAVAQLASEKWGELEIEMTRLGTLGPENAIALELLCKLWARWRVAEAQVDRYGPMLRAPKTGVPMQNPYLSVANGAADRVAKLAAELGLTPAMRGRVAKRPVTKAVVAATKTL